MPKSRHRHAQDVRSLYTVGAAAVVLVGAVFVAGGHGRRSSAANAASSGRGKRQAAATPLPAVPTSQTVALTPDNVRPNEMGRFPILMYHSVGDPPLTGRLARFNHLGLSIPAALLRTHLEMLRTDGFYPVNMRDALGPEIDVPRGKTPVVLTFDDARVSQFRYHPDGSIDPNCAIGVLAAFHQKHPDWPERATFFVLPKSQYNPTPFGQSATAKRKIEYLVAHGYELASHTTSHRPLTHMNAQQLTWEMTTCAAYFQKLDPDAPPMETMALPYGLPPAKSLLPVLLGNDATNYHIKAILMAAGGSSYSPGDKRFNRLDLPRAGSEPGYIEGCINHLHAARNAGGVGKAGGFRPYISDGDPNTFSIPESEMKFVDKTRLGEVKLVLYADPAKETPKHSSVAAKSKKAAKRG